jgi:hypothetical protein
MATTTTINTPTRLTEAVRKEKVLKVASYEATKWGVVAGAVATGGVMLANLKSKKFHQFMSVSAKVSLPVMTAIGFWAYKYEMVAFDARLYPERYGIHDTVDGKASYEASQAAEAGRIRKSMPVHHSIANYIFDHPFQFIIALGIPLTASILNAQKYNTHLTFSQKIMHSRVFAQFGVLSILLTTMGFREYMDRHGRFPDPSAETAVKHNEN